MTNNTLLATEKYFKVIDKPTHATAPDTVVHLDVDELKEDSLAYLPRHFSDLATIVDIKDTYDEKLAHYNDSDDELEETLYTIGGPPLILAMCIGATYGIDALAEHVSFLSGDSPWLILSHFIANGVVIGTFVAILVIIIKNDTPASLLPRADKKTFRHIEFVENNPNYTTRIYSALRDATSTPELREAYNSYMELSTFLAANKDVISTNLHKKYTAELARRRDTLNAELDTAVSIGRTQRKELQQFNADTATVMQDMRDNDALRAMPLLSENE